MKPTLPVRYEQVGGNFVRMIAVGKFAPARAFPHDVTAMNFACDQRDNPLQPVFVFSSFRGDCQSRTAFDPNMNEAGTGPASFVSDCALEAQ